MKKIFGIISSLIVSICLCMPVYALDIPESVSDYYLDDANVMSDDTKEYITEKNWAMDEYCGGYIEIVTEKYINCDVADYTYEIFNEWQIGGSENNNGILLVVVTEEEKYYMMYGRGIEQKIDDTYVFEEILENYFEKDFDAGNYDTAIKNTFDALYDELCTLYGTPSSSGGSSSSSTTPKTSFLSRIISFFIGGISMFVFIIVFIIVLLLFSRRRGPRGPYGGGGYYRRPPMGGPRGPMGGGRPPGGSFGGGHHSSGGSFGGHSGGGSFGGRSSGGSSRGGGAGRR